MRNLVRIALAAAMCVSVVAGAWPAGAAETVKIVVDHLPLPTDTSVSAVAARRVLQAFLAETPDIQVEAFVMPEIEKAAMDVAPLMGIASGQPPHAIYVNFHLSSSFINHGFLDPLEVLLARVLSNDQRVRQADKQGRWLADPGAAEVAAALEQLKARAIPRVWPVIYRQPDVQKEGVPQGSHVWAIPTSTLVRALMYRRDLFMEAGLDPDRPPQTWDELLKYCQRINAMPGKLGIMLIGGNGVSWGVYSFLVSNGARYVDQDEQGRWHAAFNSPQAAEAIYYLLQLCYQPYEYEGKSYTGAGWVVIGSEEEANMRFADGQIAMRFEYIEEELLAQINPEEIGLAPAPMPAGGEPSGELNARMMGVFAGSSPQQKIATMKYLWFIASEQAQRIRVKTMIDYGYGQFVNPILLEQFGYTDELRKVPRRWREVFQRAMSAGVPEPYGRNTHYIYEEVSKPINWAFQNSEDLLNRPKPQAIAAIREQLNSTAARVDKYMLGQLSKEEWSRRRWVGGSALFVIVLLFASSLTLVWRAFSRAELTAGPRPPLRRFAAAYALLAPALAIVVLWQYAPVIMGLPLALFDYELVASSAYVGIDNFATVLYDGQFWASMGRTLYYVLLVVGLGFWPPILVALLLDEVPTRLAKYTFRSIFYLPAIVSGVIMVFLWVQLYQPDEDGFLNQIVMSVNHLGPVGGTMVKWLLLAVWLSLIGLLGAMVFHLKELSKPVRMVLGAFVLAMVAVTLWPLVKAYMGPGELEAQTLVVQGIDPATRRGLAGVGHVLASLVGQWHVKPLGWHSDPGLAMLCVVMPGIWAFAGPGCIIYLAALKTVPEELIEAATIDGAGVLQRLAYITLPRIKFLILIELVGTIISSFKGGTDFILAMTGGGPQTETGGATKVIGMDIFERTFMELQYGIGAAMALLVGGLVIGLTAYQLRRISRADFRTADTVAEGPAAVGKG